MKKSPPSQSKTPPKGPRAPKKAARGSAPVAASVVAEPSARVSDGAPPAAPAVPRLIHFNFIMRDRLGRVICSGSENRLIAPGRDFELERTALPGLARVLRDTREGDRQKLAVPAEQAYGLYDHRLVLEVPRGEFPSSSLTLGASVVAEGPDGQSRLFRVAELDGSRVKLDGNHPLAGQDLVFEIETLGAREATPEDLLQDERMQEMSWGPAGTAAGEPPYLEGAADPAKRGYLH